MNAIVTDIKSKFHELGVDIPAEKIEERLEKLIVKFKVPQEEARRSVVNFFMKEYSIPKEEIYASHFVGQRVAPLVKVAEISENGTWVQVKGKVVQLVKNTNEFISQVGLIGDETGVIRFAIWANADLPIVEEGQSYLFKNIITKEWNGKIEIELNKSSSIDKVHEDLKYYLPLLKVAEISENGKWVQVKGKVVQLWENTNELISQKGLIGDETGIIRFTIWANAGLPIVEEGQSYLFKNIITKEWNGKIETELEKNSSIEKIAEDISRDIVFSGAMVDIQSGSGLIKRCPQCNRALTKGACAEHGKVEGLSDLRLKAVLDTGSSTQDILLKREVTEEISGITLESAKAMAMDALDQGVVLEAMKQKLVGKYYTVSGPRVDRYLLVESIKKESALDPELLAELINEAEMF